MKFLHSQKKKCDELRREKFFSLETPSLFVVASPFQVLCAFEAIKKFKIMDYSIIAVYEKEDPRNKQLFAVLELFKLSYQKYCRNHHGLIYELINLKNLFGYRKKKMRRAFVGYFRDYGCILRALGYLERGSVIVYLDDGNASITHLKGLSTFSSKERICNFVLSTASWFRKIDVGPAYFTIYSDIPSKFPCEANLLKSLEVDCSTIKQDGIYFIGTNPSAYCMVQNLSLKQYFTLLEASLKNFRNDFPDSPSYYVFHGRDGFVNETDEILEKQGFRPLHLEDMVEIYFVKNKINPVAVVGFMSSALYTIKRICHNTLIEGIMVEGDESYADKYDYYVKNGIKVNVMNKCN